MKRFIPFLRQLREYAEADPVLKKQAEDLLAARNAIHKKKEEFIEKEKQQYKTVKRHTEKEKKKEEKFSGASCRKIGGKPSPPGIRSTTVCG